MRVRFATLIAATALVALAACDSSPRVATTSAPVTVEGESSAAFKPITGVPIADGARLDSERSFGVKYALEGSIRKARKRVLVTAQLIEAVSGGPFWAERYDRNPTDIFEVQGEFTQQIVAALKVTLSRDKIP